jgi:transposase
MRGITAVVNEAPNLERLTESDKDELIRQLWAQVTSLQTKVGELQGRLALNSSNSSRPPSSDGMNKPKPKSLRGKSGKASGGQKGHRGTTLKQVQQPDKIVRHLPPKQCERCNSELMLGEASVGEVRQVFDLPVLKMQVIEHQALQVQCCCGALHRGQFPADVTASVQYGPGALAGMVYLNQQHMLPVQRTAAVMSELFGLPVAQATVIKACEDAAMQLKPIVDAIAEHLQRAEVVHADETGLRVNKALHWLHIAATETLTWMGLHAKRGKAAFADLGILPHFKGTLIHDGWIPYRALNCAHGLCNAHHLRELTYVFEELKQPWAGRMIELLCRANRIERSQHGVEVPALEQAAYDAQVRKLRRQYKAILNEGDALNPRVPASGKRGGTKQSKPANLLHRLREYADDVWRFMSEPAVPFTNNVAEQAVRMPKVKQKISGCFRTTDGADTFCVIRSYLATMHKQGVDLFDALRNTFNGSAPQPRFA